MDSFRYCGLDGISGTVLRTRLDLKCYPVAIYTLPSGWYSWVLWSRVFICKTRVTVHFTWWDTPRGHSEMLSTESAHFLNHSISNGRTRWERKTNTRKTELNKSGSLVHFTGVLTFALPYFSTLLHAPIYTSVDFFWEIALIFTHVALLIPWTQPDPWFIELRIRKDLQLEHTCGIPRCLHCPPVSSQAKRRYWGWREQWQPGQATTPANPYRGTFGDILNSTDGRVRGGDISTSERVEPSSQPSSHRRVLHIISHQPRLRGVNSDRNWQVPKLSCIILKTQCGLPSHLSLFTTYR